MSNSLTLYDSMRVAVQRCRQIDEVAEMRDKATALAAYARQHDDKDLDVWMSEIRLRACMRIGELSRELEKALPNKGHGVISSEKIKEQSLKNAGISTATANRYEQLVGPPEQEASDIVSAAAENYFAKSRESNEPPTMNGLKSALTTAFEKAWGTPPPRPPRRKAPELSEEAQHNMKWNSAMFALLETDPELAATGEDEEFAQEESDRAGSAIQAINRYQRKLKELYNVVIKSSR
jgi:hypothetical protein